MKDSIVSYKGFDKNMMCRDFQYQIGETFTHEGQVKQCSSGFHACPAPLATFGYYAPADSRFCVVEQSGDMNEGDDKVASSVLTVKAQIEWVKNNLKKDDEESNTGDYSAASNTGDYSAASNTGDYSAASVEGEQSVAIVTGYDSKAKASEGSWVVITERNDNHEIIGIKTAKAGVDIEPDTYYKLVNGEFIKCDDE